MSQGSCFVAGMRLVELGENINTVKIGCRDTDGERQKCQNKGFDTAGDIGYCDYLRTMNKTFMKSYISRRIRSEATQLR